MAPGEWFISNVATTLQQVSKTWISLAAVDPARTAQLVVIHDYA
jgi:hypothetical protein